jgi:hypothetical protein
MHPALDILNQALSYAKFSNPNIRRKTYRLLSLLGDDLDGAYEPGADVDEAASDLTNQMDELDEAREKLDDVFDAVSTSDEPTSEG